MAVEPRQQIGNIFGLPIVHTGDADSPPNISGTDDPDGGFDDTDLHDIAAMEARLSAIGYSDAQIQKLSFNDMVFAIRQNDHASTISQ